MLKSWRGGIPGVPMGDEVEFKDILLVPKRWLLSRLLKKRRLKGNYYKIWANLALSSCVVIWKRIILNLQDYHKQLIKKTILFFSSEDSDPLDDLEDEGPGGKGKSLESGIKKEETHR